MSQALARRADCDDVLFITEDEPMLVAVVHLTYSGIREVDTRWPSVRLYETLEEWATVGMVRDHEEFMA